MASTLLDELRAKQDFKVRTLQAELEAAIAAGDEWNARNIRLELAAARSPARLIHRSPR